MGAVESSMKRSFEQAQAAWVEYMASVRLSNLVEALKTQDLRLEKALDQLEICKRGIVEDVIENGAGRGGPHGGKGFIAERLDVCIENARAAIKGAPLEFTLTDTNKATDYLKAGVDVQQKFVLRRFSVDAITEHMDTYPDFVKQGGIYRIPADFLAELKEIASVPEDQIQTMTLARQNIWHELKKLEARGVKLDQNVEAASINYRDAYQENYESTLDRERESVHEKDREARYEAEEQSKPTLKEAGKAIGVAALLEGGTAFAFGMYRKLKSGKRLTTLTAEDWRELGIDTAVGTAKGAVRGGVVYVTVNYTPVPGAAATAMVTATYGVIAQARQLSQGKISQREFIINSETLCAEVAISAVAATVGQAIIPVPVLGSLIGSAVGSLMYDIARNNLTSSTAKLVEAFREEMAADSERFDESLKVILKSYEATLVRYCTLTDQILDADKSLALSASAELAALAGVDCETILWNEEMVDSFFMD